MSDRAPSPSSAPTETKAQGYRDAAAWHEQQLAELRGNLRKGEAWAAENGEADAGAYYVEALPRFIEVHERSARHFQSLAAASPPSPAPTPTTLSIGTTISRDDPRWAGAMHAFALQTADRLEELALRLGTSDAVFDEEDVGVTDDARYAIGELLTALRSSASALGDLALLDHTYLMTAHGIALPLPGRQLLLNMASADDVARAAPGHPSEET